MGHRLAASALTFAASSALWTTLAWSSDEGQLKDRVLKSYPEALKALETRYGNVFGSISGTEEHSVGKPRHIRLVSQFTFASRSPYFSRTSRVASLATLKDGNTTGPKETVFCCNKENSFWLVKESGQPKFAIRSLVAIKGGQSPLEDQMNNWLYVCIRAPFMISGPSMSAVIADGASPMQRVSAERRGVEEYLKIEFDFRKNDGTRDFEITPDGSWSRPRKSGWSTNLRSQISDLLLTVGSNTGRFRTDSRC